MAPDLTCQLLPSAGTRRGAQADAQVNSDTRSSGWFPRLSLVWAIICGLGYLLTRPLRGTAFELWDGSVNRFFADHRSTQWNTVTHWVTFTAETYTVIAVGLVFFVAMRVRLRRWRESMFLLAAVLGEVTIFVCSTHGHRPAAPAGAASGRCAADFELSFGPYRCRRHALRGTGADRAVVKPTAMASSIGRDGCDRRADLRGVCPPVPRECTTRRIFWLVRCSEYSG